MYYVSGLCYQCEETLVQQVLILCRLNEREKDNSSYKLFTVGPETLCHLELGESNHF